MSTINPFQNEADSIMIDDLTIENRLDRIALYGSMEITKDKAGLKRAKELKALVDAAVAVLQNEDLPDHVPLKPTENIENPFK